MKFLVAAVMATLSLAILMDGINAGGEKKVEIKEVMKVAMKGGLAKKAGEGNASDAEKKQLVELFTALSKNTPPKGDAESWKKKTSVLLDASKKVAAGDADGPKALLAATNAASCKACHSEHKGK